MIDILRQNWVYSRRKIAHLKVKRLFSWEWNRARRRVSDMTIRLPEFEILKYM